MTNEELYAYIAGLIDGEGSVSIIRKSGGHIPMIQLSMRAPAKVPKWLYNTFGGGYGEYKQGNHAYGDGYTAKWSLSGYQALELLSNIRPYIIEKLEVIELVLDFPMVGKHHTITPEVLEARIAIHELVSNLNRKSKLRIF